MRTVWDDLDDFAPSLRLGTLGLSCLRFPSQYRSPPSGVVAVIITSLTAWERSHSFTVRNDARRTVAEDAEPADSGSSGLQGQLWFCFAAPKSLSEVDGNRGSVIPGHEVVAPVPRESLSSSRSEGARG